ncbi:MAG TPA: hypothetical protein DDZ88_20620 [Verrucomicrobiales bacterium]|nr:hypothetical protein [Verrucomicrobiales bacterium]
MSLLLTPSAASTTMAERSTRRSAVLREALKDSSFRRSLLVNVIGGATLILHHTPHATYNKQSVGRTTLAEVQNRHGKFVILAPYTKQVRLIQHLVGHHLRDRVMTVHAAQGQEWDTVIFCATDCQHQYHPFLTDSTIPQGNATLNTAISRAQHNLILVLDGNYWSQRHDAPHQLLSRLMLQAG